MSDQTPEFIYRLASAAECRQARERGAVPKRDIDVKDGYFHLSTRDQALETARLHFAGVDDLVALEIPVAAIADKLKFELAPKRGEAFPHYYGELQAAHVVRAIPLMRDGDAFSFGGGK
ncbi:DUF952 domain-containing protein [Hyphococcus sp.]|uniref:DUF952 domain-containing protein n=1 Tax=Hyphococcus sp. TaxID=2038636 RepID=UPI0035C7535B